MKSANYYVQQMYMAHPGTYVREIVGEIPKNIALSATETNDRIIIKITNSGTTAQLLDIDCSGALADTGGNTAHVICLACPDPEAVNELTFTGEPVYRIQPVSSELSLENGTLHLEMEPSAFYVIEMNRR